MFGKKEDKIIPNLDKPVKWVIGTTYVENNHGCTTGYCITNINTEDNTGGTYTIKDGLPVLFPYSVFLMSVRATGENVSKDAAKELIDLHNKTIQRISQIE